MVKYRLMQNNKTGEGLLGIASPKLTGHTTYARIMVMPKAN